MGRLLRLASTAVCLGIGASGTSANPALDAGRRLFQGRGEPALVARIAGHTEALPAAAARCANCHAGPGLPAAPGGGTGPRLDARHLIAPLPRRGGPPSRYDAGALCRALRDGIDPASVVLPLAMPRYAIDDARCRLLWAYLTSGPT